MDLWFSEQHTPDVRLSIRVERQLACLQSKFQRIDVFDSPEFGRILVLDGYLMLTERDEFVYHEMIVHVPMAVHPAARRILVIGAGDGATVRELCRYRDIEQIDLVEIDEMVVQVCRAHLPFTAAALDDSRVRVYFEDGLRFIRNCKDAYDLIVVDSTDPFGPGEGLFAREFYGACFGALRRDGIMVNQHESPFYAQDAELMQRAHRRIAEFFPLCRLYQAHIPTYSSGHWLFGFASRQYHPVRDLRTQEWEALGIPTRYYNPRLHAGAFALPGYVLDLLRQAKAGG
jgi:spermidine synthase